MEAKDISFLFLRYTILLLLGLFNLAVFYFIFTPLTVYLSYFFLKLLFNATLISETIIFVKGYYANIITACVAGAAYYFLLFLNLSTPMQTKKRIYSLVFSFAVFYLLNVLRIVLFASLMSKGYQYFDFAHTATWYFGSTFMVIAIWFATVAIFDIKNIPLYTDMHNIAKDIFSDKNTT